MTDRPTGLGLGDVLTVSEAVAALIVAELDRMEAADRAAKETP